MKFQSTLRKGLFCAGFAAALVFLPTSSKAQEITNTEFSSGSNVTSLNQPVVPQQSSPGAALAATAQQVSRASESIAASFLSEQAQVSAPRSTVWAGLLFLGGFFLIARYAITTGERNARRQRASNQNA